MGLKNYVFPSFILVKSCLIIGCLWIWDISEAHPQNHFEPIELKAEDSPFVPGEFYFRGVIDARTSKNPVAFLVPSATSGSQLELVDLKGGMEPAIHNFVVNSLAMDTNLRPVWIKVRDCQIIEKLVDASRGVVEGEVHLDFAFELERGDDHVHLLDFQGGMSYKRSVRQRSVIEPVFRKSLVNALNYFHNWIEREAGSNEKLAKSVKVTMRDYRVDNRDDTVFYDPKRPLRWSDFTGRAPFRSNYSASVFVSLAYEGDSRIKDGEVEVLLDFKTFMLKSSSYVKGEKNDYTLNHEQRHFEIAQIITERLKEKLAGMELFPYNYDRVLSSMYLDAYREMNRYQEQYDKETSHGKNRSAQETWNRKIDDELRHYGVIP